MALTAEMLTVLQETFLFTSALGLTLGRKCESANKVLLTVHTSFSIILTWINVEDDIQDAFWAISVKPKKPS